VILVSLQMKTLFEQPRFSHFSKVALAHQLAFGPSSSPLTTPRSAAKMRRGLIRRTSRFPEKTRRVSIGKTRLHAIIPAKTSLIRARRQEEKPVIGKFKELHL
jgi:hypothetical protein